MIKLKCIITTFLTCTLMACGGGEQISKDIPRESLNKINKFPDIMLSNNVYLSKIAKMDNVFHEDSEMKFTFRSNGYFRENLNGHTAVVMRTDIEPGSTRIMGVGMIFGNVSGATNTTGTPVTQPNLLTPSVQIETWFNGYDTDNFLLAPINKAPVMEDDIDYDVIIHSHILQDKSVQTEQITISKYGQQIWNSGLINDPNKYIITTLNDLAIGHVFATPNCSENQNVQPCAKPWSITITKISLSY